MAIQGKSIVFRFGSDESSDPSADGKPKRNLRHVVYFNLKGEYAQAEDQSRRA